MRRNLLVAAIVASVLCLSMWGVSSAQPQNRPNGSAAFETHVALVDLALVFKEYKKFNNLSAELKAAVGLREKEIGQMQTDLKTAITKRSQRTPDTPPYRELEQEIAKKKAELELLVESSKREFAQKEASVYHQTYREVEDAIKRIAEPRGITLVLRAARDPASSSTNPQEVIKEVSQQVIYSVPSMDITEDVLKELNRTNAVQTDVKRPTTTPTGPTKPPGKGPIVVNPSDKDKDKSGTKKR